MLDNFFHEISVFSFQRFDHNDFFYYYFSAYLGSIIEEKVVMVCYYSRWYVQIFPKKEK